MHTIITIGRSFGSAGGHIGHAIGKKLGIPFYDNELISKVAEEEGYSKGLFAQAEEKSLFSFSSFFASSRLGYMDGGYVNDNVLFKIQSEVIRSIAQKGDAIFIGRCHGLPECVCHRAGGVSHRSPGSNRGHQHRGSGKTHAPEGPHARDLL